MFNSIEDDARSTSKFSIIPCKKNQPNINAIIVKTTTSKTIFLPVTAVPPIFLFIPSLSLAKLSVAVNVPVQIDKLLS